MTDNHFPRQDDDPNRALCKLRGDTPDGEITDTIRFHPGVFLRADPALKVGGRFRSPAGRLLELDVTTSGNGHWIGLHIAFPAQDISDFAFMGFSCRHAAPEQQMIRPCLRSGTETGFSDCFFNKHILAVPEPLNHVDALHLETSRTIPQTAPWRELILFLPQQDFRWHLHDLRLFLI